MKWPVSIHAKNLVVLLVALLAATLCGWNALASLALGGGIQIVNLRALERGVAAMLTRAAAGQTSGARALLSLRWLLTLGLVALTLLTLPVDPIAFSIGLSTLVPAVIWHGLSSARFNSLGNG